MSSATDFAGAGHRVTLLTDFGTADGYAAAMKGVIAAIAPSVVIDDASHDISPGDVRAASWALGAYWRRYPPGTVHVAIVDPGVGSARRPLAIEVEERIIIAPDNGLVTAVLQQSPMTRAVEITGAGESRDDIPATFHGRDVFAPAAGRVASGVPLHELGPPVSDPVLLPVVELVRSGAAIIGTVVHVDRFGNLITDIPGPLVHGGHLVVQGGVDVPVARTYSDVERGACVAMIGSRGTVEVSVRDGNAADVLGAARGAAVVWHPPSDQEPVI